MNALHNARKRYLVQTRSLSHENFNTETTYPEGELEHAYSFLRMCLNFHNIMDGRIIDQLHETVVIHLQGKHSRRDRYIVQFRRPFDNYFHNQATYGEGELEEAYHYLLRTVEHFQTVSDGRILDQRLDEITIQISREAVETRKRQLIGNFEEGGRQ